jgi:hypothetical protein
VCAPSSIIAGQRIHWRLRQHHCQRNECRYLSREAHCSLLVVTRNNNVGSYSSRHWPLVQFKNLRSQSTTKNQSAAYEIDPRLDQRERRCPLWVKSGHMRCKKACRFTPNSDHKSGGHVCFVPENGHVRRKRNIRFGPKADVASGRDGFLRKATFIKFNQFSQRNNSFFP